MGADASIYSQFLRPVRSVTDFGADLDRQEMTQLQMQGQRGQNALLDVTRQGQAQAAQSQMEDRNALQRVAASWAPTTTVAERVASLRSTGRPGLFTIADQLETQDGTRRKTEADIGKTAAETAAKAGETVDKALARYRNALDYIDTKAGAVRWLQAQYADPVIGPHVSAMGSIEQAAQRIPDSPQEFERWRQLSAMGMEKFIADQTARRGQDITAETSRGNNAATVAASRENAAAVRDAAREQAGATRDAARTQRDQATEMKMADDYRAQSKEFKAAHDAYQQISATLASATTSPAATLAAATKFMKILDPGSVVRESELGMALAASGVIDRGLNYIEVLKRGKVLTPTQAADFKDISTKIYQAAQQVQQAIDADYQAKAKTYGLRPEMVTQNLGQNAKVVDFGSMK